MKRINYILLIIIVAAIGCKKPYNPPIITAKTTYLVVEGVINTGPDSTIINLSRTVPLTGANAKNPQAHAIVTVENDQNGSFPLTETTPGKYVSPGLNLDNTRKYRLRIKTPDNNQYLSDFVPVKVTPPVDSVGFNIVNNGIRIYVNTHDPKNSTHYYRWDYAETWQFHALYVSSFITNGTAVVDRTAAQQIYYCFAGATSTNITIASTSNLSQDVVSQAPITAVSSTSEKLELRYSILVREYALTNEAYNFWQNLKKNTEELGSIFDAQPSTAFGNIHNITNSAEVAIGYIGASTVQSKRIFIANAQLPVVWRPTYPYTCGLDSNYLGKPGVNLNQVASNLIPLNSTEIIISPFSILGGGYLSSGRECADCTYRGVVQTPSFWQ